MSVDYKNETVEIEGLITLSSDPNFFSPISKEGDSGALVYTAIQRQPIGIVLGANSQFTYVIPIGAVFSAFPNLNLFIIKQLRNQYENTNSKKTCLVFTHVVAFMMFVERPTAQPTGSLVTDAAALNRAITDMKAQIKNPIDATKFKKN
jgi:hypothetical protein